MPREKRKKEKIRIEKNLLMIPGPSEPDPEVLASLTLPVMAHYGSRWAEIYADTLRKLQQVFRTRNEVILLPSPGQAAVEMAIASLTREGDEAFVCANGYFSEIICDTLDFYGVKPILIKAKYGSAVSGEEVKRVVQSTEKRRKEPRCLFLVHNETSTGVTNPAAEIMRVCRDEGLTSILDSISAFGGIDVRTDDWGVDYCIGYASKALGGIFGVTPVSVSRGCWELARKIDSRRNRFLNLNVWRRYIDEWTPIGHPHPSTMPTNIIIALNTALDLVLDEGIDRRYRRHANVARSLESGLESFGLKLYAERRYASNTVTAVSTTPQLNAKLRRALLETYGIVISDGLESLSGRILRIGHMGSSATARAISTTLAAIGQILRAE